MDLGNTLSPQKLKVTVEAGSDTENSYIQYDDDIDFDSPSRIVRPLGHRMERTTTTTVPLKGLSDSEGENHTTTPKRGRGRPRKVGTPVPSKLAQRSDTPTQKNRRRRKSIGEEVYGDSENDADFRVGKDTEVKRRRARKSIGEQVYGDSDNDADFQIGKDGEAKRRKGRKSIGEQVYGDSENDADFQVGKDVDVKRGRGRPRKLRPSDASDNIRLSGTNNMVKGRRKTLNPDDIVVHEDVDSTGLVGLDSVASDLNDALSPIDSNAAYSPSKYSMIRSSTTNDVGDEANITLSGWNPGIETPRDVGLLSLKIGESPRNESSDQERKGYPLLSSFEKAQSHGREAISEPDEILDFDTILEGEEFSMISVDSVPSLRQHLSSPPDKTKRREASKIATEPNTSTAHGIESDKYQPPSNLSGMNVEEVTSMLKPRNRSLLSVQNLEMDDSFSSIPSEILEAATPGRNLPKPAASEITAAQREVYDDSFSAIPSTILDAATPAPLRQALFKYGNANQGDIASDRLNTTASIQIVSSALRKGRGSATARLLTPEETPSPGDLANTQNTMSGSKLREVTSNDTANDDVPGNESYISTRMGSSPPPMASQLQTYTTRLQPESQLLPQATQTPAITFSSPTLPPPIQMEKDNPFLESNSEEDQKPVLSPAARAGRMLQDLVVPSSPRSRSESLGSPFKSPVAERKSSSAANSINKPSQQVESLARPGLNENQFPRVSQNNSSVHDDDPFLNSVPSRGENIYNSQGSGRPQLSNPRLSNIRSEGNSLQSDDDMSWQAESVVLINHDTTSNPSHHNYGSSNSAQLQDDTASRTGSVVSKSASTWQDTWAAERDAVSREIEAADATQVIVIDSDDADHSADVGNEGEDFGLLLETLNSSSPAHQTHYRRPRSDKFDKSKQSLSPDKMNSKRVAYSDELSHLSSPIQSRVTLTGNVTNNGFNKDGLSAVTSSSSGPRAFNFNPRVRERGPQDVFALLAASPNKLPPVLPRNSEDSTLPLQSSHSKSLSIDATSPTKRDESQPYFRQISQKLDFKPRIRDPESSFGSSPIRQPSYGIFGAQIGNGRLSSTSAGRLSTSRPQIVSSSGEMSALPPQDDQPTSAPLSSPDAISNSTPSPRLDKEQESLITDRTKEWTESVCLASTQMQGFSSPTKSCLRSPLKTPIGAPGSRYGSSSPKTVAFVSSSPIPSSPMAETLSSTTWSREHWILLDGILQNWRPENQMQGETRRRNSTRVISRLLGKNVRSGKDKLKLEQWHLEVVDEFRGCVPGWKEETIAMRVFALIIGERDRAFGLVGRNHVEGKAQL